MLGDLCDGDLQLRSDIVRTFTRSLEVALTEIGQAIERGDHGELLSRAHALKGGSSSVGAVEIARISEQLCSVGRSGVLAAATPWYGELQQACVQTRAALVQGLPPGDVSRS